MKVTWNLDFSRKPERARRLLQWLDEWAKRVEEEEKAETPPAEVESEAA